jgi:hypothetical protein
MMKVLSRPRAAGKTYQAVIEAAKTGARIVTISRRESERVKRIAFDMGLKINDPICFDEAYHKNSGWHGKIIVDNANWILQRLLGAEVHGITIDGPPAEIIWSEAVHAHNSSTTPASKQASAD